MVLKQPEHKKAEPVQQRKGGEKKNPNILLERSNLPGEDGEQKELQTFNILLV